MISNYDKLYSHLSSTVIIVIFIPNTLLMIRFFTLLSILFFFSHISNAQLNLTWRRTIDDGQHSREENRILLSDTATAGVYSIGTRITQSTSKTDLLITKMDTSGNQLWQNVYSSPGNYDETVSDAVIDHQGNLVITGNQFSSSTYSDILIIKYSTSGTLLWSDTIDGSAHGFDSGNSICVDDSDNYYVGSDIVSSALFFCGNLTKYTPAGSRVYNIDIPAIGSLNGVDYKNGFLYINATTYVAGQPYHTALFKFDTNGNFLNSFPINNANTNLIVDKIITDSLIFLLETKQPGPFSWPNLVYEIICIDTALNFRWATTQSTLYSIRPKGFQLVGNSLYVSAKENLDSVLSTASIDLRCFSSADGKLLHQTSWWPAAEYISSYDPVVDLNGTVSIAAHFPDTILQRDVYVYMRFDSTLVLQQYLILPDNEHSADVFVSRYNDQNIFYMAKAADLTSWYNNLVLYRLSNNPVIIVDPWLGSPRFFPNPTSHELHVTDDTPSFEKWSLLTTDGKIVIPSNSFPSDRILRFNVSSGVYLLQLSSSIGMKIVRVMIQ